MDDCIDHLLDCWAHRLTPTAVPTPTGATQTNYVWGEATPTLACR